MSISRRQLIRIGGGAGLLAASSPWRTLLAQTGPRIMTTIPSSGEQLPAVGIGTRDFRSDTNAQEMQRFKDTLESFHAAGGKVIDTSPNYGEAETVIGKLLQELGIRDEVFMATKVDREDQQQGIVRMNRSFRLLGGDHPAVLEVRGEILTLRELHDQKVDVIGLADLVEGCDVGVLECGEHARLALEASETLAVGGEGLGQHLDRALVTHPSVLSQIHAAHAARADVPELPRDRHGPATHERARDGL